MKVFKGLIFMFLLSFENIVMASIEKKTICLNMVVKNESQVIRRSLNSVKHLIDYWVIVDTGSDDETPFLIEEFMKDIPGELHHSTWVNFEYNRNEALKLAKDKADYILFIDADDEFIFSEGFTLPTLDRDFYYVRCIHGSLHYYKCSLVKSCLDWEWVGVMHEYVSSTQAVTWDIIPHVTYLYHGGGVRSQDPLKFQKDALILEKALQQDPNNARHVFYLAQSYLDCEEYDLALKNYERRSKMGEWQEEVFLSKYRIGTLQEALKFTPSQIIKSYCDAYVYRQTRIESLYRLAVFYSNQKEWLLGYLTTSFALSHSQPADTLYVEKWIYEYGLLLQKSVCAYWIGRFEECANICEELLAKDNLPLHIRELVQHNLIWAEAQALINPGS